MVCRGPAARGGARAGRLSLDGTVPGLLIKVGRYPLHHGSVGVVRTRSVAELLEAAGKLGFPVVLKNDGRWERLAAPAVAATTVVRDPSELERLASSWPSMPSVVLQEYLPHERTEDWSVHVYCGS